MSDKALNKKHLNNPKEGDYWQEMCCGICVVLKVMNNTLIICKTKKEVSTSHWTWDLDNVELISKKKFKEWLTYDTISDKTWCDVMPENHKWAVEEFDE